MSTTPRRGRKAAPAKPAAADASARRVDAALEALHAGDRAAAIELLLEGAPLGPALGAALAQILASAPRGKLGRPAHDPRGVAARAVLVRALLDEIRRARQCTTLEARGLLAQAWGYNEDAIKHLAYPEGEAARLARGMDLRDAVLWMPHLAQALEQYLARGTPEEPDPPAFRPR